MRDSATVLTCIVLALGFAVPSLNTAADRSFEGVRKASVPQTPSIEGRATDPRGDPLPGTFVTAILESGGVSSRVTAGSDGVFRFDGLPDGIYRVDFELRGFQLVRRNHVRVPMNGTVGIDATMPIKSQCECVQIVPVMPLSERAGQVFDQAGRPLPHARVTIATPRISEVAYADNDGRFRVRLPTGELWSLTASDSGFNAVTLQVSTAVKSPFVFALPFAGTAAVPVVEPLNRKCSCPGDLFTHDQ
jgi:Carboxypeptidase regulatory-like domain